jgi:Calcineurin-like phosphoesterase
VNRSRNGPGWGTGQASSACAAVLLAALLVPGAVAAKSKAPNTWPPPGGKGSLFVHFGEEHVNDLDGMTILPRIVRTSARYRPDLVTMSGDKVDVGNRDELTLWRDVMKIYDRRGVPWLAGVGNHDGICPTPLPGTCTVLDYTDYREMFAKRPYPMGDRPGYPNVRPRNRPDDDPEGASSHYYADVGNTRWIFLDNSCWSLTGCDAYQNPSGQNLGGETQFEFLRRVAGNASDKGKVVFAVMHVPTRDPGDQLYRTEFRQFHIMGKIGAIVTDNPMFEDAASDSGVDGVFVAHIKGQFLYEGSGGVPYYIDGGGGGELYTTGPVGTDHGYWHGFRLIRVRGEDYKTDVVPIFVRRGIKIAGGRTLEAGVTRTFEAFGRQPVFKHTAKVDALELRDPDPTPRLPVREGFTVPPVVIWIAPPLLVLLVGAVRGLTPAQRRRLAVPALAGVAGLAVAGISLAQQSEPTSTPVGALPNPARIWTTSNPKVLKPVASETDDARRNPRTQTADGTFKARCPGKARLTVTSGFQKRSKRIVVTGHGGPACRR